MMEKIRHAAGQYAAVAALAVLMAFNYQIFILNNAFAPAGLSGLATMAQHVFHFSMGYITLIINIPLAIFTFLFVDRKFAARTAVNVIVFSVVLLLLQNNTIDVRRFVYHTDDGRSTLLAPFAAGVVNGFIYGESVKAGGSTGGMDYISAFIHKKKPAYSLTHISFVLNTAVACISYFVYDFSIEPVILCIVYCSLTTYTSDRILQGGRNAIRVEMITGHPDEITQEVIAAMHHTTTLLHAEGGFSHEGKTLLVCIINKHQITKLTEILKRYPDTFASISQVTDTVGNFRRDRNS